MAGPHGQGNEREARKPSVRTGEFRRGSLVFGLDNDMTPAGPRPAAAGPYARLREQLPDQRVQIYTSHRKNEDEIDLLAPGITILNVKSIKGQEFDTVFIMEVDELLREAGEANKRKMYMLCARARDNLFLMHEGDRLPRAVIEQLPGADVLEWP